MPCRRPPRCPAALFSYETPKALVVRSGVVGGAHRALQLLVLAYFLGWVFLHEKAYQVRDSVIESSVVTKVKGVGRYAGRVLDTADYVTPPQGTSVFVVVTKQILTENQAQGVCPESEAAFRCSSDRDCRRPSAPLGSVDPHPCFVFGGGYEWIPIPVLGPGVSHGSPSLFLGSGSDLVPPGLLTGRCVPYNLTLRTCEMRGWCPPEEDTVDAPVMLEAENFTLFIKNSIRFPLFGFEKANLPPPGSSAGLGRCRFHPEREPLCPILRLGDIVSLAGHDFATLAATGAVLGIKIAWICDLDRGAERCLPRYSFTRLDGLGRAPAPGYNFRHARYYRWPDGTERRTLTKAFGIRFDVLVYGSAGKFAIVPTLVNAVAALTSIGLGTVLCDIILLNFLEGAERYKAHKFEEVPAAAEPAPHGGPPAPGPLGRRCSDAAPRSPASNMRPCLLLALALLGMATTCHPAPAPRAAFPAPNANGTYIFYVVITQLLTFSGAENYCRTALGGNLASVHSVGINTHLRALARTHGCHGPWIGARTYRTSPPPAQHPLPHGSVGLSGAQWGAGGSARGVPAASSSLARRRHSRATTTGLTKATSTTATIATFTCGGDTVWGRGTTRLWDQHHPDTRVTGMHAAPSSPRTRVWQPCRVPRHARYYRWPDGTERRTLTKAFGIRFDVLVYGSAGKFAIVPTLVNAVAALTSIGLGTVLCDIILLNFLEGAERYKAHKFEEVPAAAEPAPHGGDPAPWPPPPAQGAQGARGAAGGTLG
ncbi:P2X purinoceptor 3 [Phaenicophaeus curvirostris]|uniref:P2X purinoceptor 3 n=1 Tax=Phaenicophaeus curvirostris TaxID=33595 RepID=UPI0037F0FA77